MKGGIPDKELHLYTYEELVREEQTKQFVGSYLVANAVAQDRAAAQNEAMIAGAIMQRQANMGVDVEFKSSCEDTKVGNSKRQDKGRN